MKDLQDRLNSIDASLLKLKNLISEHDNLELEVFEMEISKAGELHRLTGRQTKAEHSKIIGVFSTFKGNGNDTLGSKFRITVQNKPVVSRDFIDFNVIEKTNYISREESMFIVNEKINMSDVIIEYTDGNTTTIPYTVYFYFVCEKK